MRIFSGRVKINLDLPFIGIWGMSWWLVLLCVWLCGSGEAVSTCSPTGDSSPAPGECEGPSERAFMRLANVEQFNNMCAATEIPYYKDDDPTQPLCGQCVPGSSGVDDPETICKVNEYCTDEGVCQAASLSPLYMEPCPYEQGNTSSSS